MKKKIMVLFITLLVMVLSSCNFFASLDDSEEKLIDISMLSLGKSTLSMKVGSMDYIAISVEPKKEQRNIKLNWSYDESIITCDTSSNWGITITALKEGTTQLKCNYNGFDATCIVNVSGYEIGYEQTVEPYIYSNTSIYQTTPGVTEKVYVSLFGGDANDIDGYTWTTDNSSVVNLQPTGQYCLITAKDSGYARVKITHKKAAYPYYIGVYVFADNMNLPFITTENNILTMNQADEAQTINVSLINAKDTSLDSSFKWEIVCDENSKVPIGLEYVGNKAVITPISGGSCTLKVSHPDASFPLEILCRVITVIKNVYIEPSETIITLDGDKIHTVNSELKNIEEGEFSVDEFEYILDDYNVAEITSSIGNKVSLKGKANGSCKLIISHPKSAYSREVLVIVQGQLTDAIDSSIYITTTQNYIRTKIGEQPINLNISLKGGVATDSSSFIWSVKSTADDGVSDVIKIETTNGTVDYSRAAAASFAFGNAIITPNAEGTAVITISHPKVIYPTEVLVKVLSENAILEEPLYFTGDGIIRLLNGASFDYSVELKGKNKKASDEENINFEISDSRLSIVSSGPTVSITAPALDTGSTISNLMITHPKVDVPKKVLVLTADDEETLMSMKALYADKLYFNFEVGESVSCIVDSVGFDTYDEEGNSVEYDFSPMTWTIKNSEIASIEKSVLNPLCCNVTGLKAGSTTVTASIEEYSCEFTITVYPEGTVAIDPEVYFTTTQNVISIKDVGKSATAYISAINLPTKEYSNIEWTSSDESIATVVANGVNATITAKSEGESVISITHPDSQNVLKIYVKVGSEYVIPEPEKTVYISADNVITLLRDDEPYTLQSVLVNYTGQDTTGFSFSIDNEDVAVISAQSVNGVAYINPVGSGQAEITISHPATPLTKKVLVLVGNSSEELAGLTYLSTSNNVVTVGEGNTKNINVSIKNSEELILDGYAWSSSNPAIVDVSGNGTSAVLTGNGIGTAIITVTNKACKYPLTIIAQCIDPIEAAANPYIQLTSSVLTLNVGNDYSSITADLIGGTEQDFADFIWQSNDSSICSVYGQNEVGKIKALQEGTTYITVSHPKATYPAQILAVCDKVVQSECYITVPSSILNMKPTDSGQSITATLVNGTATDRYNFNWSLDVYDIIDFQYSSNICTIVPKQSGSCTITITHPKAPYPQQIIVNVQEYTTFGFPNTNVTMMQGDVEFFNMQVPVTNVSTYIEYSTDDEKICKIEGTKTVAQITSVSPGTTTVRAKLISSSTKVVQAESEMLMYVKEKPTDTVYISSAKTIYTLEKEKSQILYATLVGVGISVTDNANLKWSSSDSDIIKISGLNTTGYVSGDQIYITALKSGEAIITCEHEKAQSKLQFYVIVPADADKKLSLNKTYVSIIKGSSGTSLKASIENSTSSDDYNLIEWSIADESGKGLEIARLMGSGQQVTIYPVTAGNALVTAVLKNDKGEVVSKATCQVYVENATSFVLETSARTIEPFERFKVKYTVSPPTSIITWTTTQVGNYFKYNDLGHDEQTGIGYVEIEGISAGNGTLYGVTDKGAKSTFTAKVDWGYKFILDKTKIAGSPEKEYKINLNVKPTYAKLNVESSTGISDISIDRKTDSTGNYTGEVIITVIPKVEGEDEIYISAINQNNGNEVIGSEEIDATYDYDGKLNINFVSNGSVSTKEPTKKAYFSEIRGETIVIGDGETFSLGMSIAEQKLKNPKLSAKFASNSTAVTLTTRGNEVLIAHPEDITAAEYKILTGYAPTYKGSRYYPDGKLIKPEDFEIERKDDNHNHHPLEISRGWIKIYLNNVVIGDTNNKRVWMVGTNEHRLDCGIHKFYLDDITRYTSLWSKARDTSLDNSYLSMEKFEEIPWYYIPRIDAHYREDKGSGEHIILNPDSSIIDSYNIDAQYQEPTTNTATIEGGYKFLDTLIITCTHDGKPEEVGQFSVYLETRNCECTYSE
ncbi:MAG: hypothetical protein IIW71_05740 [Treponema sp.]|nr:hypothetical protein [Treponema sp.]